jgi:hypothetical protein
MDTSPTTSLPKTPLPEFVPAALLFLMAYHGVLRPSLFSEMPTALFWTMLFTTL